MALRSDDRQVASYP